MTYTVIDTDLDLDIALFSSELQAEHFRTAQHGGRGLVVVPSDRAHTN